MKGLLNKLFYPGVHITDYKSIQLEKGIEQQAFLYHDGMRFEVSGQHWPLSLQPLVFGVWVNKENHKAGSLSGYSLLFEEKSSSRKLASVQLTLLDNIEIDDGILLFLSATGCRLFHTALAESHFLYRTYFRKPGFTYEMFATYASAFSYPRKVRLVSFKNEDYYNIFPMDFVGNAGNLETFVFGLRHTNQALLKILESKKLVVADVPGRFKKDIYNMGAYHSSTPPPLHQLPFSVFPSKEFGFYVPACADSYQEIEISHSKNLGSHMFLLGRSVHYEVLQEPSPNLYHVHFLLSLLRQRLGNPFSEA
jgi:flavin reductase (DIM6/NTAB) family NADH-FMN oxidoreductase RutF